MSNKITFVDEEMKQINELQLAYVNLQNMFGQLGVNRLRLEQQVEDLDASEQNLKTKFGEIQTADKFTRATAGSKLSVIAEQVRFFTRTGKRGDRCKGGCRRCSRI